MDNANAIDKVLLIGYALLIVMIIGIVYSNNSGLNRCLEQHSYDTCMSQLR